MIIGLNYFKTRGFSVEVGDSDGIKGRGRALQF